MSTLRRFLAYSLAHQRPVRVIVMDAQGTRSMNITVQSLDERGVTYLSAKNRKTARHFALDELLAASYARGDEGDSLKNAEKERQDDQPDKGPAQG